MSPAHRCNSHTYRPRRINRLFTHRVHPARILRYGSYIIRDLQACNLNTTHRVSLVRPTPARVSASSNSRNRIRIKTDGAIPRFQKVVRRVNNRNCSSAIYSKARTRRINGSSPVRDTLRRNLRFHNMEHRRQIRLSLQISLSRHPRNDGYRQ